MTSPPAWGRDSRKRRGRRGAASGTIGMAERSEPVFDADAPVCPRCLKPLPLCVCDEIQPIANRTALLILQHPQEQDRLLGTARDRRAAVRASDPQRRPVVAEPRQGARASGRSETVGDPLSRLGAGRRLSARARGRRIRPQGRGARRPGARACRHRGGHPARRNVEPGQDAVVAQCLAAQGQAHRAQDRGARRSTESAGARRGARACRPSKRRGWCSPPGRPAGDGGGGGDDSFAGCWRATTARRARRPPVDRRRRLS